jgi:ubiquinone/menaquinone biosynthesis C-methylase UbiE
VVHIILSRPDGIKRKFKTAKDKVNKEGLQQRVEVKECDLCKLAFEEETFDLVFCGHALCFIKEQETVVKELEGVLKKGCPLILSGQNRYVLSLSMLQEEEVSYAFRAHNSSCVTV